MKALGAVSKPLSRAFRSAVLKPKTGDSAHAISINTESALDPKQQATQTTRQVDRRNYQQEEFLPCKEKPATHHVEFYLCPSAPISPTERLFVVRSDYLCSRRSGHLHSGLRQNGRGLGWIFGRLPPHPPRNRSHHSPSRRLRKASPRRMASMTSA